MSATADKARYFLEQSIPELKEYEKKGIFQAYEITSISRKRSDFEHKINARGSTPSDYARYAEFEANVDALRRKRVKRLGIKSTTHNGQRRIFFVYDRGTRKFPGDIKLWMQSIEYARRQKAYKKLAQIFTSVLRLHPTKSDLWIYAAQFAMEEHSDMNEARSYMQRGLRFCKASRTMWVEFIRLEFAYIAKIYARRQILGIDKDNNKPATESQNDTEDMLHLPKLTAEDIAPEIDQDQDVDEVALRNLENTPAMSGAIPIAIFDAAMTNFNHDPAYGHQLFDVVSCFGDVPAATKMLNHILTVLRMKTPSDWHTYACAIASSMIGQTPDTPEWISALRTSLAEVDEAITRSGNSRALKDWCASWLQSFLTDGMDPAVKLVLTSKLRSLK